MKVLIDLNVLLDILQERELHYIDSSAVLSYLLEWNHTVVLPGHAVTTIYYLLSKYSPSVEVSRVVDWMLQRFEIVAASKNILLRARILSMNDFEDAVVASCAEAVNCDYILTRNTKHFFQSPIQAISPIEFLGLYKK